MIRDIQLTHHPIDETALARQRRAGSETGAAVSFAGIVRGSENAIPIKAIDYESFDAMALSQFEKILDQVESRWGVQSVRLVHRKGTVPVGEPSLWVEVLASHRGEAFAACQFLIDEMKRLVPIWKRPML